MWRKSLSIGQFRTIAAHKIPIHTVVILYFCKETLIIMPKLQQVKAKPGTPFCGNVAL